MRPNNVTILIWIIVALALLGIYFFLSDPTGTLEFFDGNEIVFRVTFQFLLLSVVAGAIAQLYKDLERRREMRKALREVHSDLLTTFNDVKKIRRKLRAELATKKLVDPEREITADLYSDQIELLIDAQLSFEVYVKRAMDKSLWFGGNEELEESLGKVEDYLNNMVKEYQEKLSEFKGDPPILKIGKLPKLCEFVGPYETGGEFSNKFKYPIRDALSAIGVANIQ